MNALPPLCVIDDPSDVATGGPARVLLTACSSSRARGRVGDTSYVELSGDLDAYSAPRLRLYLEPLCAFRGNLVVATTGVRFIDAAGLRLLVELSGEAAACGTILTLHDPSPVVRRLLELTGTIGVVPTCTSDQPARERALASSPIVLQDELSA